MPVRLAILAIATMSAPAFAQPATLDPVGTWLTEDGRAKIRLEHCAEGSEKICGFVAWMKDPLNEKGQPRTDIKNPDPAKRNRPSLGMEILLDLKPEDTTHFAGEVYNADDGKTYEVTVGIEKPAELEVRGCLLHILCGSQSWQRVADVAPPGVSATKVSTTMTSTGKVKPPAGAKHDVPPAQ